MKAMLKDLLHRYILILLLFFTLFYPLLKYIGFEINNTEASAYTAKDTFAGLQEVSFAYPEFAHYVLIFVLFAMLSAFFFLKLRGRLIAGAGVLTLYFVNLYANGAGSLFKLLSEYAAWTGRVFSGLSGRDALYGLSGGEALSGPSVGGALSGLSGDGSLSGFANGEALSGLTGDGSGLSLSAKLFIFQGIQIFLLMLICFLFAYLSERAAFVKYSLLAVIFASGVYALFAKKEVSSEGAAFWFTFVFFSVAEPLETVLKKNRASDSRSTYLSMLWPVWTLFLIIMLAVPKPEEPYDWAFAKSFYNSVNEKLTRLFENVFSSGRDDFAVITSGFSENAVLEGGSFSTASSASPILHAASDIGSLNNIYLTGTVMDRFNGRGWDIYTPTGAEYLIDTAQLIYSVKLLRPEFTENYISGLELKIEFDEYATRHIFTPSKTRYLMTGDSRKYALSESRDMLWDRRMIFKDTYRTFFYHVNRNPESFYELLSSDEPDDRALFEKVCSNYQLNDVTFDSYLEYRRNMKEHFSENTELTARTAEWLSHITENCENDYEALAAVEGALKQYTYTLTPGSLPEDIDSASEFLDWFIFEKQEGYCTYYATAFTLLARAMGYPARYVQGFLLPMRGTRGCTITGGNSHAWAEVYFDNAGWITYEPTPGYDASTGFAWKTKEHKEPEKSEYNGDFSEFAREDEDRSSENIPDEQSPALSDNENIGIRLTLLAAAILLGLLLLIFGADFIIGKIKYRKLPAELRYRRQMSAVLRLLDHTGLRQSDSDTLDEIRSALPEESEYYALVKFISEYEKVVYGGTPVSAGLLDSAVAARVSLLPKLGRFDRIHEKYLMLKQ